LGKSGGLQKVQLNMGFESEDNLKEAEPQMGAVEFEEEEISSERLRAFCEVTHSQALRFPPTFPTVYRWGEFQWLKRLGYSLRDLLHTEQEYEYRFSLKPGEKPKILTRLIQQKTRRGLTFLSLKSEIIVEGKIAVVAHTQFVLRGGGKPK